MRAQIFLITLAVDELERGDGRVPDTRRQHMPGGGEVRGVGRKDIRSSKEDGRVIKRARE